MRVPRIRNRRRAGALALMVLALGLAGCTAPASEPPPTGEVVLQTPEAAKGALPGSLVTFPLIVRNSSPRDVHVVLTVEPGAMYDVALNPRGATMGANQSMGVWAVFELDRNATGPLRVPLRAYVAVLNASAPRLAAALDLRLDVAAPAAPAKVGDTVRVDYVGRLLNGSVFDTSVQAVGTGPFPRSQQGGGRYEPLRVDLGPQGGSIKGFWTHVAGLGANQSRTFIVPPWDAYGNATQVTEVPRTEALPRTSDPFERLQRYHRAALAGFLNASHKVGDTLLVTDGNGNPRNYTIRELDAQNATLFWEVRIGDVYTLFPPWPRQSRVADVTPATVVFRTTPADLDEAFTWYDFWPNATRIEAMNSTSILLKHSPDAGAFFELPNQPGEQGRVLAVGEDTIRVAAGRNQHPLAGQTLVFDVTVRELVKG